MMREYVQHHQPIFTAAARRNLVAEHHLLAVVVLARVEDKRAGAFSHRDEFGQRSDLGFFHHPLTMRLDGALGRAQRVGDLLVGLAADDQFEDVALARRQPTVPPGMSHL